ncbi:hypothetical protein FRB90_003283, partial [Tulasnella sp. 427]
MLPSPPISSSPLPPIAPVPPRPVSTINSPKVAARPWTPRIKAGQIVTFSISLDGLCELFLDNPALVGALRRMRFNKYLGVVHDASIYDPLGAVADGLHRFSRPPPEDLSVTLIGPGPTPGLPAAGIPIANNTSIASRISSGSDSSLRLSTPTALPFNPAFAYIHKPIRLISHDVHSSQAPSDNLGSGLCTGSQIRLADAVWHAAGSWEASAPTSVMDVSLDNPTALANVNVLVDVYADIDLSISYAHPSCLQEELAEIQKTIAQFYCPPCTSSATSLSVDEETTNQAQALHAPTNASNEPGAV